MPEKCEKEIKEHEGTLWWICHRCGSLWSEEMMGKDWLPLSCPYRPSETKH